MSINFKYRVVSFNWGHSVAQEIVWYMYAACNRAKGQKLQSHLQQTLTDAQNTLILFVLQIFCNI